MYHAIVISKFYNYNTSKIHIKKIPVYNLTINKRFIDL